jgi:hypothetical protein
MTNQGNSVIKSFVLAAVAATLFAAAASAQTMTCADYLKSQKEMAEAMKGQPVGTTAAEKEAAALDKKITDYCVKNPKASADEAVTKAMSQ